MCCCCHCIQRDTRRISVIQASHFSLSPLCIYFLPFLSVFARHAPQQSGAAFWALAAARQRSQQSSPEHGLLCIPCTMCPTTAWHSSSHMLASKLLVCSDVEFPGALGHLGIMPAGSTSLQLLSPLLRTDGLRVFLNLQHPAKLLNTPGCQKSLKDRTLS